MNSIDASSLNDSPVVPETLDECSAALMYEARVAVYNHEEGERLGDWTVAERQENSIVLLNKSSNEYFIHMFIDDLPTAGVLFRGVITVIDEMKDRYVTEHAVLISSQNSSLFSFRTSRFSDEKRRITTPKQPDHNPGDILDAIQNDPMTYSEEKQRHLLAMLRDLNANSDNAIPEPVQSRHLSGRGWRKMFSKYVAQG